MATSRINRTLTAIAVLALGLGLAACTTENAAPGGAAGAGAVQPTAGDLKGPGDGRETRQIIVQPGQSLGRIAQTYHVPAKAIIAANNLAPPYNLKIGARLTIPGAAARASGLVPVTRAGPATPRAAMPHAAATAVADVTPARVNPKHTAPEIIPLDAPSASPPPRPVASRRTQEEIPLDAPSQTTGH